MKKMSNRSGFHAELKWKERFPCTCLWVHQLPWRKHWNFVIEPWDQDLDCQWSNNSPFGANIQFWVGQHFGLLSLYDRNVDYERSNILSFGQTFIWNNGRMTIEIWCPLFCLGAFNVQHLSSSVASECCHVSSSLPAHSRFIISCLVRCPPLRVRSA